MILFINCCPRAESRTLRLAEAVLKKVADEPIETLNLYETPILPLNRERLEYRSERTAKLDFSDPIFDLTKQFIAADKIVIAAPYWDLSFPAQLKVYFEYIYAVGLICKYDEMGNATGLANASDLYFVTTAGGPYSPDFGYKYVEELTCKYFGVGKAHLIVAEMLDIIGFDANDIVNKKIEAIEKNGFDD